MQAHPNLFPFWKQVWVGLPFVSCLCSFPLLYTVGAQTDNSKCLFCTAVSDGSVCVSYTDSGQQTDEPFHFELIYFILLLRLQLEPIIRTTFQFAQHFGE